MPSPPAMPLSAGTQQAFGIQNDVVFPLQEGGAQAGAWLFREFTLDPPRVYATGGLSFPW